MGYQYQEKDGMEYTVILSEEILQVCEERGCTPEELVNQVLQDMIKHPETAFKIIKENRTDKCPKGTPGKPYFSKGDWVGCYITPWNQKEIFCMGKVNIIDRYGTFEQNEEPSYDILVDDYNGSGEPCLIKHVRESQCYDIREFKKNQ